MPSDKTRRLLFGVAREYGIDRELLHERIENEFNRKSISELTDNQIYTLVDKLKGKNTHNNIGRHGAGRLSQAQHKLILEYADILGWTSNPKRLQGFIRKYSRVDDINWLTAKQASKIIEGLKKLIEKKG